MMHSMVKRSLPVALSTALLLGSVPLSHIEAATKAASTASSVFAPAVAGKISIGGGSYIQLEDVQQLGQTVRFTLTVVNNGSSDLQFIDYWVKLRSIGGTQFTVNLVEKDKDKNRIPAKSKETFTFYSSVNEATKLTDLKFDFVKWDFSVSSFQRHLGSVRITATYNNITPAGKKRDMQIEGSRANAYIKRVNIGTTSDDHVANLTFALENTGSRSITVPAYEFAIVTSEGLSYPLTVEGLDQNTKVHPRLTKEITLKGELPATLKKNGWKLVMTEKVGENPVTPVASFVLPASTGAEVVTSIPVNGKKELIISDQTVNARVARTIRNENDKNYLAAITFSFVNEGKEPVTLPKYSFAIRTSNGLTYPVTANMDNISLNPRVDKEIELKATLPNSVGKTGWKLLLQEPVDSAKPDGAKSTIATFDLPNDNPTGLNQGGTYTYSNDDGSYQIKFDSVQRVPWEDEDILSAELVLSNPGQSALPIPELTGYFMLDGKIKIDAKTLQKDSVIDVKPNGSIHMTLYGKIPYTYSYSKLTVSLQEKTGQDTAVNVVEFNSAGDVKALPVIAVGSKHKIEGVGRASEVSIRDIRTYEGVDSYFFTTLVDIKNLEKRHSSIAALVGHFKTTDDIMYPVTISEVKDKISPQGTATLLVSATLPKSVNTSELQLLLGEGVKDGKISDGAGSDAYINAVRYQLPVEVKEPKSDFNNMILFPYTISLRNLSARINTTESFIFKFNYEMTKNSFVNISNENEHTLVIEFEDKNGDISHTEEFTLNKNSSAEPKADNNDIALGQYSKEIEIKDPVILQKLQALKTFKVKVYDKYMGQKKLLAVSEINWF